MSDELPGPHHCIGTARAVTEIVFRRLRAQCAAGGGSLSPEELESCYSQIIDSFTSGFDLFELRHHQCMDASLGIAEMPFARDKILATFLRACGEKSARAVFSLQVEHLGMAWIGQLFDSLAHYVREHVHANIDGRLIDAYVETAKIPKIKLTIEELLKQEAVQHILLECVTAFETPGAPESIVKEISDWVNDSVAGLRGVAGPHVCKITEDETRRFLTLLPRQLRATLNVMPAIERVAEPPISVV
jgi:hypothetical protein